MRLDWRARITQWADDESGPNTTSQVRALESSVTHRCLAQPLACGFKCKLNGANPLIKCRKSFKKEEREAFKTRPLGEQRVA